MGALAWLIIPAVAALLAGIWALWAGRTPRDAGDPASLAEHRRFLAAMERTTSGSGRAPTDRPGR
ncbi:hypothetical protein [Kitasatospora sp. NPDC057223]|uniref:hypothetical protein n=1 Tax=Kitasatospora sp. NPDC057223 TaxID=3346055 RepID=UPI00364554EB